MLQRSPALTLALALAFASFSALPALAKLLNGFDTSNMELPSRLVKTGGPKRDGIPAIDKPRFIAPSEATFLRPSDRVIGLEIAGIAKAYPIRILDRHEIVNDQFANQAVAVTYCPLCGSGIVFDANIDGQKTFGVSGLLYNSDVLLYDRQTESLWSQIAMIAVSGPMKDRSMTPIPSSQTTWEAWQKSHPSTSVLSNHQGIYQPAAYQRELYPGYEQSDDVWFPVARASNKLRPKAWVLGVTIAGVSKAYPFEDLARLKAPLSDSIANLEFNVTYDASSRTAAAYSKDGAKLHASSMYWFAWYAFHPQTDVYRFRKPKP